MKNSKLLLVLSAFIVFAFTTPEEIKTAAVDATQSKITWTGSKVGGSHTGNISIKEGNFEFEGDKLIGGQFIIDMNSITNTDLEGEMAGKLVSHLKSDDFFGVEKYPTATLKITEVIPQGPGKYKVAGDLTIKEITKSVKFPAEVSVSGNTITAKADIVVDRAEYNVRYGSDSFFDNLGDKVIYDDFTLSVNVVALQ